MSDELPITPEELRDMIAKELAKFQQQVDEAHQRSRRATDPAMQKHFGYYTPRPRRKIREFGF